MKRDMYKTASQISGRIPTGYDMNYSEVLELVKTALGGVTPLLRLYAQLSSMALFWGRAVKRKTPAQ